MWSCWLTLEGCKLCALHGFRTLPMENTGCHRVQQDRIDRLSLKASVYTSPVRGKLWESCGSQQDKSSLSGGTDMSLHLCRSWGCLCNRRGFRFQCCFPDSHFLVAGEDRQSCMLSEDLFGYFIWAHNLLLLWEL